MALHTILGAGGAIGKSLVPILQSEKIPIRLVSRSAAPQDGTEAVAADLTDLDATRKAVSGSDIVYLLAGLKYDVRVWSVQWPKIMSNVIQACKESSSRLIFFDNVYMYGAVQGAMTEETPFHPTSEKGEVRAQIALQLLNEMKIGNISALIARSADFYGPGGDTTSVPNMFVFAKLASGKKAQWLFNADVPHSFTYIPDAARSLYLLAHRDEAFGQTWHLPTTSHPLTGREFASAAAAAMGCPNDLQVMPKWMVSVGALFDRNAKEVVEMAYQNAQSYVFDSSKFDAAFDFQPVSYADGIAETAASYKKQL